MRNFREYIEIKMQGRRVQATTSRACKVRLKMRSHNLRIKEAKILKGENNVKINKKDYSFIISAKLHG